MKRELIEYVHQWLLKADEDLLVVEKLTKGEFGVAIRYPGDQYEPSDKEVIQYMSIAKTVGERVKQKLNNKLIN